MKKPQLKKIKFDKSSSEEENKKLLPLDDEFDEGDDGYSGGDDDGGGGEDDGDDGYGEDGTWDSLVAALESGDFTNIPLGTYTNNGNTTYTFTNPVETAKNDSSFNGSNPGYKVAGFADGGQGTITVGPIVAAGVSGDTSFTGVGTPINAPNYGITASWSSDSGWSLNQNQTTGIWTVGVGAAPTVPGPFDSPFASGNAEVFENGTLIGSFSLTDQRGGSQAIIYQTGTIPVSGAVDLPSNYDGGPIIVNITIGLGNHDSGGNVVVNGSQTITITVPHL